MGVKLTLEWHWLPEGLEYWRHLTSSALLCTFHTCLGTDSLSLKADRMAVSIALWVSLGFVPGTNNTGWVCCLNKTSTVIKQPAISAELITTRGASTTKEFPDPANTRRWMGGTCLWTWFPRNYWTEVLVDDSSKRYFIKHVSFQ